MIGGLRKWMRHGRRRGSQWVRALDAARDLTSAQGRARLFVRLIHGSDLHQLTEYSEANRYPEIFDRAARHRPDAARILSFGCSTGEEIAAIRLRHPEATIVGCEINPRSRKIARRRFAGDNRVRVVAKVEGQEPFDIIYAMAVLQFQPHRIADQGIANLSAIYPFERFDRELARLVEQLRQGGLLCVMHTHYRVEDSVASEQLEALAGSPGLGGPLFCPDGRIYDHVPTSHSMFLKVRHAPGSNSACGQSSQG